MVSTLYRSQNFSYKPGDVTGSVRVNFFNVDYFGPARLILRPQVRVSWSHDRKTCVLLNPGSIQPNIVGSLIADVVLLIVMLIGLLRLHLGAGNGFFLGRVLWKQVR